MDKMKFWHRFAFKLSLYIITSIVIIFLIVLIYNYHISKDTIMKNIIKQSQYVASKANIEIAKILYACQQTPEVVSYILEYSEFTDVELLGLLRNILENNHNIYGSTIAFEPYMFNKTKYYFSPYFYREGVIKYVNLGSEAYNYFKWDWYTIPKRLNKGIWSEPYFDNGGGNIYMVTYSQPFYKNIDGKRVFSGVVTCDISLEWLGKLVSDIKIFDTGYVFVLSPKGIFIEYKGFKYYDLKQGIFSLAAIKKDNKLKHLAEKMTNNQTGFEEYYSYFLGKSCFIYYAPLKETGWSIGVVIPKEELFYDLNIVTFKLFIIGLIGYTLALALIIILANRMTIPLRTLANATYEIGQGDFDVKLPSISSKDEIGMLSHSFCIMQKNLIKYIANLQETTVAKEKIEKELSIAREIQQNLLPQKFPYLKQIDLYAALISAREVGGDIYDFFFIDEKHLCFAIGDVSGKGVPAALFMAVVKTLLRAKVSFIIDPAEIFNAMNNDLYKDNKSYMFVTFFLGILNIETGVLEYSNAGHNPPLIHTANKGFYYFHTENTGFPLGIAADVKYIGNKLQLLPEDIFFLYTDRVTEAMNVDNIQFSEEKLIDILDKNKDETVINIVNNVKLAIDQHAAGTIQSDDITMFVLKYNG